MSSDPTNSERSQPPPLGSTAETTSANRLRRNGIDRATVQAREKEAFGGMKFGSAFFGWLTSIGAIVLLGALVSAIAALIGMDTDVSSQDLRGVGIGVAVALLVILFISYFAGGYVAGRMARFNGLRQGVAVWLWAVAIALVLTAVGLIVDGQSDITSQVNLPAIPVSSSDLTTGGLIGLAIVLVTTLIAAMLGGLAGMRFHRRVDKAGFDISQTEKDAEKQEIQRARTTDPAPVSGPYEQPHGSVHGDGSRTEVPGTAAPGTAVPGTAVPHIDEPPSRPPS